MKVHLVNPFVTAACEVLTVETGSTPTRGGLSIEQNPYTTEDVTAVVGISGTTRGSVYVSMSEPTARAIVGRMIGSEVTAFDELAQSGIAELANVVAGTATITLANQGFTADVSPPLMLVGAGARITSFDLMRVVVPLTTPYGIVKVHVALRTA